MVLLQLVAHHSPARSVWKPAVLSFSNLRKFWNQTHFLFNDNVKRFNNDPRARMKVKSCVKSGSLIGSIRFMVSFFKPFSRNDAANSQENDQNQQADVVLDFGENKMSQLSTSTTTNEPQTFEPNDPRLRSPECLKNAAGLAVDSTSAVLSQTVYAITKIEGQYVELVEVLIQLLEYQIQVLGHQKEEDKMADLILETRDEIEKVHHRKQDLNLLFTSAEKLSEASAEVAFITGSQYASTSIGERLHSAQTEVRRVQARSQLAEEKLRQAQVRSIEALNAHAEQEERVRAQAAENVDPQEERVRAQAAENVDPPEEETDADDYSYRDKDNLNLNNSTDLTDLENSQNQIKEES